MRERFEDHKYTKDTAKLEPELIPGHTKVVVDTVPRDPLGRRRLQLRESGSFGTS